MFSIRESIRQWLLGREINSEIDAFRERAITLASERDMLVESLSRIQMELENEGWQKFGELDDAEFTRDALEKIIQLARAMYIKNPNISRAVDVQADYVFAQGIAVTSEDEGLAADIDKFWEDGENRKLLTSHPATLELERELQVTGNLFFTFHGGEVVQIRRIDISEIADIYCNPEDRWTPWFFKRVYKFGNQERIEWYPALNTPRGATLPPDYPDRDKEIRWDIPVYHVKTKTTGKMRFGIPEVFPSLAWALAYKRFLENWATIMAAYARLAVKISGLKNQRQVAAAKSRLQTTVSSTNLGEDNPSPTAGSTFIGREGVTVEAVKTAGATTPAEEGKPLLNMVASGVGLPNTFFGDASVGNYATAKTLDRPTELKILSRQRLWEYTIQNIVVYATAADKPKQVVVSFPEILERNVTDRVRAVVNGLTGFGKPLNPDICPSRKFAVGLILDALKIPNKTYWLKEFAGMWGDDKVPPIPVPKAGGPEDPSQGGAVGDNG
jgi:hypothetical protein